MLLYCNLKYKRMKKLEELTAQVIKREKEEWEHCIKMHDKYGRDDRLSEQALARWGQWNDFKYMLKQINNK